MKGAYNNVSIYCNYYHDLGVIICAFFSCLWKRPPSKERKNPNELIEFCLNEIHKELNLKQENVVINTINICESLDKIKVINGAIENFQKLNNSIISNCFFWFELKL